MTPRPPKSADPKNKNKESAERAHSKTNILNKKESVNVSFTFTEFSNILVELESVRVPVSFRIRDDVYMKYKRLSKREKRLVRAILELIIERVAEGGVVRREGNNVIINMPINVALAMAKNEEKSDPVLLKRLAELKRKLKEYSEMIREYEAEISRLRKELSERDKQIKELQARLAEVDVDSLRAKVEAEVVRRFKSVLINLVRNKVISKEQWVAILNAMGW